MIRKCCKNDGPFPKQETAPPFFYILVCPFNNIIHMLFSFKADPLLIQSKDFTIFHYDLSVDAANGHDVTDSIINGKIVMKNREVLTLDEERIRFEAEKHMNDIIKRAY